MSFSLRLISQEEFGVALVEAEGEATAVDFPLGNLIHFDNLFGPDWDTRFVILDMDRVTYIDSSAIGWLLSSQKCFRTGGGRLMLHSVQPQVRQILDLLKIDRTIPLATDANAARALLRAHMAAQAAA
jgi:anti-anti-sigma factor